MEIKNIKTYKFGQIAQEQDEKKELNIDL